MDRGEFANLVKRFEKQLFKAKSGFKEASETTASFKESISFLEQIEQEISKNPSFAKDFQLLSMENSSVSAWKKTTAMVDALKTLLEEGEESQANANRFLESFRNSRAYAFPDSKSTISFLQSLADIFSISKFELKPQFIGTVDMAVITKDLKLKADKNFMNFNVTEIKKVMKSLIDNKDARNLVLEGRGIKVFWQNPRLLRVDAKHDQLRSLDKVCNVFRGECVEKIV